MEMESICWLGLLVLFVIIEIATMGLTTIWFAGGSVAGFIASILGGGILLQVVLFLAISIILLIFTRPFAAKYINKNKVRTNIDELIGKKAVVIEQIDNLAATGQARLEGKEWTARTEQDNVKIPEGTTVTVLRISGVKLIVEPINEISQKQVTGQPG